MAIAKSLFYFLLAGICEIGGGYLVWLWLRENKSFWVWRCRGCRAHLLWHCSNIPAGALWQGLRGIWRNRTFDSFGK